MLPEGSPERKKLKDMLSCGLEEGGDDESSDGEEGEQATSPARQLFEYNALPPFKDLYKHSPIIVMSFEFGPSCIPLSGVGMILNFAGNHLLHYINVIHKRKIFFPMHKVTGISLLANGDIVTTAVRSECSIICEPTKCVTRMNAYTTQSGGGSTGSFHVVVHKETTVTFKSRAVILSMGGQ